MDGVTRTVFFDENALLLPDVEHSEDEGRFVLLGLSSRLRPLASEGMILGWNAFCFFT